MKPVLAGVAGFAAAICVLRPVWAEGQPFVTLYTAEVEEPGEAEIEQTFRWKSGHADASFNGFESRSEVEYGLEEGLQLALYANYEWSRLKPPSSPALVEDSAGVSAELIYVVADPERMPFGLALYLEPTLSSRERELEFKLLLQKNIAVGLRCVANINFEDTWEKDDAGRWTAGGALEFGFGIAYDITPQWTASLEFNNERAFDGLVLGQPGREVSSSYYFGPTIQYVSSFAAVTLGVQGQLPWAAGSSSGAVVNGYTADAERFRLALRLSREL
jgi:hypothetical protein